MSETIVYIDTNIIRTEQKWEKDFSQLNPKGIFSKILDLVEIKNLRNKVDVGIPETVLLEFQKSKKENFTNIFSTFKNKIPLFEKMDCCDFTQFKLPEDDFDYQDYIKKIIENLNNDKKSIKLIKIKWDNSKELLQTIYSKAIDNKPPFERNKGNGKDKGFKDNLIWETIVQNAKETGYKNYFFLTENTNDFNSDLETEFEERVGKTIKIVSDYNEIEKELNLLHALLDLDIKVKKHIEDKYFISQLKQTVSEQIDIDSSTITEVIFKKAIDFSSQSNEEMIEHPELSDLDSLKSLLLEILSAGDLISSYYVLFYTIKTEDKEYKVEVLFDFETKEIMDTYFEEVNSDD